MTKIKHITKISRRKKEASTHGRNFDGTNKICWTLLIWFNDSVVTLQVAVMENRTTTVTAWEVNWKQTSMLPGNAEEVRVTCLWGIKMHHSLVAIKSVLNPFPSFCFLTFKALAQFCVLRKSAQQGSLFLLVQQSSERLGSSLSLENTYAGVRRRLL